MQDDLTIKKTQLFFWVISIVAILLTPIIAVAVNIQQTQENKKDIECLQEQYQEIGENIASINRSLEFLVEEYKKD